MTQDLAPNKSPPRRKHTHFDGVEGRGGVETTAAEQRSSSMAALTGSVQAIGASRAMLAPAPQFVAALPRCGEAHRPGLPCWTQCAGKGAQGPEPDAPFPPATGALRSLTIEARALTRREQISNRHRRVRSKVRGPGRGGGAVGGCMRRWWAACGAGA